MKQREGSSKLCECGNRNAISKGSGKGGKRVLFSMLSSARHLHRLWVRCVRSAFFFLPLDGAPKAIGVRSGLDDVGAVGDAIEQCFAESRIWKHRRPFRKRQVGRDEDGRLLGALGDDLKQKLRPGFFERNITHLIDGQQFPPLPTIQCPTELSIALRLKQFVDQTSGRDEAGSSSAAGTPERKGQSSSEFSRCLYRPETKPVRLDPRKSLLPTPGSAAWKPVTP